MYQIPIEPGQHLKALGLKNNVFRETRPYLSEPAFFYENTVVFFRWGLYN